MMNLESTINVSSIRFFAKLTNGDFGLAKTYWVYGVLVGFILNLLTRGITSLEGLGLFMLAYTAYQFLY